MIATRRTISLTLLLALAAAILGACQPAATVQPTSTVQPTAAPTQPTAAPTVAFQPVTITDDGKTAVTVKAEPQRIVSLVPSMTEILFALGLGDRVVGDTTYCDYPEAAKMKEKVGEFAKIDLERVVGLSPDLIFASSLHAQTVAPALRERGLTVVVLEATDVETTLAQILTVGQLTGRSAEAQQLVQGIRSRLDAVAAKVAQASQKPRVFWELGPDLYSAGKGSFVDDLITRAGGDNVGRRLEGEWPQFNLEALVAADPEVVVLADAGFGETADTVKARPGWSDVSAVKNGRIVEVADINIVSRQGPRIAEAVEYVAQELHPELYK